MERSVGWKREVGRKAREGRGQEVEESEMIEGIHSAIEECRDRIGQELTLRKLEDRVSKPAGPSTSPSSPSERGPWPDRLAAMLERDCATAQSTEACSPFVMVSHGD